jgi:TolB protein
MSARTHAVGVLVFTLVTSTTVAAVAPSAGATTPGGPGRIAYVGYDGTKSYTHIWTMASDGSNKTDITASVLDSSTDPSWSPDGASLAFSRGPSYSEHDIWRMDADGGNAVQLTTDSAPEIRPSWSPDGSTIVFEAGAKIVTISATDGSGRTVIGSGDAPSYSPNGNKIVYARYRSGYSDIFAMNADGTGVTNLTKTDTVSEFLPDWSPDGRSIVFQRSKGDHDLWTMRPDGSKQYLITRNSAFDGYPSFSPDGTSLVAVRDDAVVAMNASGSQARTLVPAIDVAAFSTDWQPLPCTSTGTDGPDELTGTSGNDVICAGAGDDIIDALEGDDVILGGAGKDSVYGRDGDDVIAGGAGADILRGESGNDRITGDSGEDTLKGGPDNDYLFAWDRAPGDVLVCGTGSDRWAYEQGDIVQC